jgi:glutamine synthetase
VPLGWLGNSDMILDANPQQEWDNTLHKDTRQTIEFRSPDGSADLYNLLAGLVVAANWGLNMPKALEKVADSYVDVDIFKKENKTKLEKMQHLPTSCWDSADCLEKKRKVFEMNNVFPMGMIDNIIRKLKTYEDKDLSERLYGKDEEIRKWVIKYIHTN